jgi:hypothetical protein
MCRNLSCSPTSVFAITHSAMHRKFICAVLVVVASGLSGCNSRGIPIVSINGQVTFGGAAPPKEGKINFSPVEGSSPTGVAARPGYAKFAADGSFTVTTYAPGDGLIPGKYTVKILCFRQTPSLENQDAVSYVPTDFHPEITIPADVGSFDMKLDVPATRVTK